MDKTLPGVVLGAGVGSAAVWWRCSRYGIMEFPPGETWEFFFELQGDKAYGKLLLRKDRKQVVILSAHHPRKTKLRCE